MRKGELDPSQGGMTQIDLERITDPPAARRPMTMDARMVRTRGALHKALLTLAARKPFDDITIRDIATEARINYATFFRHFPTKAALLEDLAADQIRRLVEISLPAMVSDDVRGSCMALCRYVDDHRTLWSILLNGGAERTMRDELIRVATANARVMSRGALPEDLGVSITVGAMVEILAWWLRQPKSVSMKDVAKMLDCLAISPGVQYR